LQGAIGARHRPRRQLTRGRRTGWLWSRRGTDTKEYPDGRKEQTFIRVDTHSSQDDAVAFSVIKAQQIIDEQGDRLFR
jgi:hypothetical protein